MGDDSTLRGQSTVLGAILVFGILVASLSIFQVYIVPNQNADAELAHNDVINDDFERFHSGLMNAAAQNEEYTASFKLGARYPARLVSVNPPSPQGTLSTSELGTYDTAVADIDGDGTVDTLADICGIDPTAQTQSLRYTPDYNEVRNVPENAYENTITYRESGDTFVEYDQQFVNGNVLRLRPLVGTSVSTSKTGTEAVELYAGSLGVADVSKNTVIKIPTQLTDEQWEEIATNGNIKLEDFSPGEVELKLEEDFTIQCTPVGVSEAPENSPVFTPGDGPGEGDYLNPVGDGSLELKSITSKKPYNLNYISNDEPHSVKEARVATVSAPGSSGTTGSKLKMSRNGDEHVFVIGDDFTPVDSSKWTWSKDATGTVKVTTGGGGGGGGWLTINKNTYVTIQFILTDGTVASYQVELP